MIVDLKYFMIILFLILSPGVFAQSIVVSKEDPLIKTLHVKKNTVFAGNGRSYSVYYYNKNGNIEKSEARIPVTDQILFTTYYYYDCLQRIYCLKDSVAGPKDGKSGFTDVLGEKYGSRITYYEYWPNNKIKRIYYLDFSNKMVKYECLYLHDSIYEHRWYDAKATLSFKRLDYYENKKFIYKSDYTKYDSSGVSTENAISYYINEFNSNLQLVRTKYKSPTCESEIKYVYYKNGLLKKTSENHCNGNVRYRYKYKYYKM